MSQVGVPSVSSHVAPNSSCLSIPGWSGPLHTGACTPLVVEPRPGCPRVPGCGCCCQTEVAPAPGLQAGGAHLDVGRPLGPSGRAPQACGQSGVTVGGHVICVGSSVHRDCVARMSWQQQRHLLLSLKSQPYGAQALMIEVFCKSTDNVTCSAAHQHMQ